MWNKCGHCRNVGSASRYSASWILFSLLLLLVRVGPHSAGVAPHSAGVAPHSAGAAPHSDGVAPHSAGVAPHSAGVAAYLFASCSYPY